jgi:hypothetical protein
VRNVAGDDLAPIPYFPGRDALWLGGGRFVRQDVDTTTIVHPLAAGAERYYRYALGDAVTLRLPDGARVPLRELRVTPVRAGWQLSVGSFWFDARSGQLVRAVYRVTAPLDLWDAARQSGAGPSAWIKPLATPMTGQLDVVTVEHALYEGRFWLPRAQFAEGTVRSGDARVGVRVEQTFRYDGVNGAVDVGAHTPRTLAVRAVRDSLARADSLLAVERDSLLRVAVTRADSQRARRAYRAWEDSSWARYRTLRQARDRDECAATGTRTSAGHALRRPPRRPRARPVRLGAPGRLRRVRGRPLLGDDERAWAGPQRAELRAQLGLDRQPPWAPQPVRPAYGWEFARANRVEGVSHGAALRRELGAGWRWEANARLGVHDLEPNGELLAERTDGRTTWRAGAYRRLAINDDWGAGSRSAPPPEPRRGARRAVLHRAGGWSSRAAAPRTRSPAAGCRGASSRAAVGARGDAPSRCRRSSGRQRLPAQRDRHHPARAAPFGAPAAPMARHASRPTRRRPVALGHRGAAEAGAGTFAWGAPAVDDGRAPAPRADLRAVGSRVPRGRASARCRRSASGTSAAGRPCAGCSPARSAATPSGARAPSCAGSGAGSSSPRDSWTRVGRRAPRASAARPVRGAGGGLAILNGLARFDVARGLDRGARWRADFYAVARF